ncbi:hypothetical protein [Motilimonas eburnea]|uniref:hypothetical protein n=1 Tax=Motilimonas eburnea TaxID=1737488 RepID=UPI001E445CA6|nr:hypothetical protein [Motilimonas eburnea]MCE2571863.1 hypothetical protein [Motilimonas eburnea]
MKSIIKTLTLVLLSLFSLIVLGLGALYYIGGQEEANSHSSRINNNNFNGAYTISYSNTKCGQLGYEFKRLHHKRQGSDTSKLFKSNCKLNANGELSGYIYSKSHPNLRVFWSEQNGRVAYDQ